MTHRHRSGQHSLPEPVTGGERNAFKVAVKNVHSSGVDMPDESRPSDLSMI